MNNILINYSRSCEVLSFDYYVRACFAGDLVAIVGQVGSGKSSVLGGLLGTILHLILLKCIKSCGSASNLVEVHQILLKCIKSY